MFTGRVMRAVLVSAVAALCIAGCASTDYRSVIDQKNAEIMFLKSDNDDLNARLRGIQAALHAQETRESWPFTVGKNSPEKHVVTAQGASENAVAEMKRKGLNVTESKDGIAVVLQASSLFEPGKLTTVSTTGAEHLRVVAETIKRNFAGRVIRIEGHTDDIPITRKSTKALYPTNKELSVARGTAVLKYLTETLKLDSQNMTVSGFGDTKPRKSNSTKEGQACNRRVEVVILNK